MIPGQWVYAADPSWDIDKPSRRLYHRSFMVVGMLAMLAGYICIVVDNVGQGMFLGYNFKARHWQNAKYLAHCWIGTCTVVLVLVQALIGMLKLQTLQTTGSRSHTYHGWLGKAILTLATVNIVLGCWFIGWSLSMKIYAALTIISVLPVFAWPTAEDAAAQQALLGSKLPDGETKAQMVSEGA